MLLYPWWWFSCQVMSDCWDPMDCSPPGTSVHRDSPGKNTGVGCHFLLQGIFLTQESNLGLLHWRQILYWLSYKGSPMGYDTIHLGKNLTQISRVFSWVLYMHACVLSHFSHVWLFVTLGTLALQAPLSMRILQEEYWSRLLFPPPGDLPHPGIEPMSLTSPVLSGRFFTTSATCEAHCVCGDLWNFRF